MVEDELRISTVELCGIEFWICLIKCNLLKGIVNLSGAAWSVVYICLTELDKSFNNNFPLFRLETKTLFTINVTFAIPGFYLEFFFI